VLTNARRGNGQETGRKPEEIRKKSARPKNCHNLFRNKIRFEKGGPHMRIAHLIFTGSIAALAVLTAPALAKNSNTQKTDDASTSATSSGSSPCHAYQQAPDGSWNPVSCQEVGAQPQAQTQHRSAGQGSNEDAR